MVIEINATQRGSRFILALAQPVVVNASILLLCVYLYTSYLINHIQYTSLYSNLMEANSQTTQPGGNTLERGPTPVSTLFEPAASITVHMVRRGAGYSTMLALL